MSDDMTPNPGSPAAYLQGCKCPILDNHHGEGRGGDGEQRGWWISGDCPLHAKPAALEEVES